MVDANGVNGEANVLCTADKTGINTPGSHAEYMVAYGDAIILLNGISYEQGVPVFCAGYTVWSGLRFADPKPHEKIAVLGIGGLGHLAIQFSKARWFLHHWYNALKG